MEITSIIPAIKVAKENNMMGSEEYFSLGNRIKITDLEGILRNFYMYGFSRG